MKGDDEKGARDHEEEDEGSKNIDGIRMEQRECL